MSEFKIQVIHGLPETTSLLDMTTSNLWFYFFCPKAVYVEQSAAEDLEHPQVFLQTTKYIAKF